MSLILKRFDSLLISAGVAVVLSAFAMQTHASTNVSDYGMWRCYDSEAQYEMDIAASAGEVARFTIPLSKHDLMTFQFFGEGTLSFDFREKGGTRHRETVNPGDVFTFEALDDGDYVLLFENATGEHLWYKANANCVPARNVAYWRQTFGNLVKASASAHIGSTMSALQRNTSIRLGQRSTEAVSRNEVFLSTEALAGGTVSPWNAWFSAERRVLDGGLDGHHDALAAGSDVLLPGGTALVGAALHYGALNVVNGLGTTIQDQSYSIGPYFAASLAHNLTLEGHASYAEPEFTVDSAQFRSTRLSGGLSLYGAIALPSLDVAPFLRLSGFSDDQPPHFSGGVPVDARSLKAWTASVGASVALVPRQIGGLAPYASLALEHSRIDDSLLGRSQFTAPRVGLGLRQAIGGGVLRIDFDAGKLLEDTKDYGIQFGYQVAL
ncbi:autotransporter domain-containing protein [Shimia sp.]|uniref:autotransporter domain-containing protein n=1 Tax=Shimia sp. TaxID=1954381 RepID=UPI003B8C5DBF